MAGVAATLPEGSPSRVAAAGYVDGAPPGHTGGFGEPGCQLCHFDAAPVEGGGVAVEGFPEAWEPGRTYPLLIRASSPGMRRAGFQLSVRFGEGEPAGRQAGALRGEAPDVRVLAGDSTGVLYAGHARPAEAAEGVATWEIGWVAPTAAGPRVVLHVAANAANGDDSEFGDAVYTDSVTAAGPESAAGPAPEARAARDDISDGGGGPRCPTIEW